MYDTWYVEGERVFWVSGIVCMGVRESIKCLFLLLFLLVWISNMIRRNVFCFTNEMKYLEAVFCTNIELNWKVYWKKKMVGLLYWNFTDLTKYLLTVVDQFSRWTDTYPILEQIAELVTEITYPIHLNSSIEWYQNLPPAELWMDLSIRHTCVRDKRSCSTIRIKLDKTDIASVLMFVCGWNQVW